MSLYDGLLSEKQESVLVGADIDTVLKVNGHFHTPYSYSAFSDMEQVFKMAVEEEVDVLGINDFYSMDGYAEFARLCLKYKKFPLFNIEFMGLLKEEQDANIRVNDPSNPGRTYFSGKGLDFPVSLSGPSLAKLQSVRMESDKQTREMLEKASVILRSIDKELVLDYKEVLDKYTKGMVRERHIAQVIREKVFEKYKEEDSRRKVFEEIYGGKACKADMDDLVELEGEIRSALLKNGGAAFVKEDPKAFLEISEIKQIIIDAGGIPCYPVLLDDKNGAYTDYEADMNALYEKLTAMNVWSLELIPGRNKLKNLKPFVEFFHKKGFLITFGTEHNTPALEPLSVSAGDGDLDPFLLKVAYEGACVIAAHQYRRSIDMQGYIDLSGIPQGEYKAFANTGNALIKSFIE